MKITEPKTPYAKHYDPAEDPSDDDEDMAEPIDPNSIDMDKVDGLPSANSPARKHSGKRRTAGATEDEIPGLSLGEPEEAVPEPVSPSSPNSKRPRAVHVDSDDRGYHDTMGEEELAGLTPEEREKHRRFEELRKKHYEMKNVASLLGHPESIEVDEEEEDDEEDSDNKVPPVPSLPSKSNGSS